MSKWMPMNLDELNIIGHAAFGRAWRVDKACNILNMEMFEAIMRQGSPIIATYILGALKDLGWAYYRQTGDLMQINFHSLLREGQGVGLFIPHAFLANEYYHGFGPSSLTIVPDATSIMFYEGTHDSIPGEVEPVFMVDFLSPEWSIVRNYPVLRVHSPWYHPMLWMEVLLKYDGERTEQTGSPGSMFTTDSYVLDDAFFNTYYTKLYKTPRTSETELHLAIQKHRMGERYHG